jgi:hypothetical protein
MTQSVDAITAPARSAAETRLYPFLVAAETVGAAVLYWQGLPIYRRLARGLIAHDPLTETLVWTIAASVLIQVAYWTGYRSRLSPPLFVNAALGHVVLFASRLIFLLATAIFLLLFVTKPEIELPTSRYIVIFLGLFSLFCYTRELERFGNRLLGREGVASAKDQK